MIQSNLSLTIPHYKRLEKVTKTFLHNYLLFKTNYNDEKTQK